MVNIDYLYNPEAYKEHFDKSYFSDKKLGFQVIENATILPHRNTYYNGERVEKWYGIGGIADSNGEYVTSGFINNSGAGEIYTPPRISSLSKRNGYLSHHVLSRLGTRHN